jgi:hypothetical protein
MMELSIERCRPRTPLSATLELAPHSYFYAVLMSSIAFEMAQHVLAVIFHRHTARGSRRPTSIAVVNSDATARRPAGRFSKSMMM